MTGSKLTLMLSLLDKLAYHCLDNADVTSFTSVAALNGFKKATHPLSRPPKHRPNRATQKFVASPTVNIEMMVPPDPMMSTGLRPIRSERAPQYIPMAASAREKAEMRIPE